MVQQNISMAKKIENRIAEVIMITLIIVMLLLTSSCGTSKRAGGCGGNPTQSGN